MPFGRALKWLTYNVKTFHACGFLESFGNIRTNNQSTDVPIAFKYKVSTISRREFRSLDVGCKKATNFNVCWEFSTLRKHIVFRFKCFIGKQAIWVRLGCGYRNSILSRILHVDDTTHMFWLFFNHITDRDNADVTIRIISVLARKTKSTK